MCAKTTKHIVLGVAGGIAAFKAAALTSLLAKRGIQVHVCMTAHAREFATPLTFETLSKNAVITDAFVRNTPFDVAHVELAKLADAAVIAPATANILAKAACGIADDFLSTFLLAAECPVLFAPAMNTAMYHNPAVQQNIATLRARGKHVMGTGSGLLACGDTGEGRMAEPEQIVEALEALLAPNDFAGRRVLVTAGPTRERIDDVRFLSNRSSGKMGYAVARAAAARGAEVTLVSGPCALPVPLGVRMVPVESAAQMLEAVFAEYPSADVVVKAAAVADYKPAAKLDGKLKKAGDFPLELVRTVDILQELGRCKQGQILVGFAAEAADLEANARSKLARKNLDLIAANDITDSQIAFGSDQNALTLYFADGSAQQIEACPKDEAAHRLLDAVAALL